ncbi:MAG TPA: alpha/beta fold hydrolase [Burkholderiales bacterium]
MKVERRGSGRALVYLHPAGGVRWTRVLERLAQASTLHVPTFPGFDGTATETGVNTRRDLAGLVGDYIEKEIGAACDVMGCSFGGAVALWLALERPEFVDHLVLECPAGLQTIDPALRKNPHAFYKALFAHPEKVTYEKKPEEIEARNRAMLAHYGAEDGKDQALLENIARVGATTLILHGTEDRIILADTMRLLKGRLARAFLVYVWDAAHSIEVDQPERMGALVESFLERSEAFVVPYA